MCYEATCDVAGRIVVLGLIVRAFFIFEMTMDPNLPAQCVFEDFSAAKWTNSMGPSGFLILTAYCCTAIFVFWSYLIRNEDLYLG